MCSAFTDYIQYKCSTLSAGTEHIQYTSNKRIYAVYTQYTK